MPEHYRCNRLTPGTNGPDPDVPGDNGSADLGPPVAGESLSDPEARSCSDAAGSSAPE